VEDEDEEEEPDEDDGKEPRTLGQGVMVNTSADDVDTMVESQPIVIPEQGEDMPKHTIWRQPPAPAPRPQSPELPHNHNLRRLIPSVGRSIGSL
jgi:hypothetical protein